MKNKLVLMSVLGTLLYSATSFAAVAVEHKKDMPPPSLHNHPKEIDDFDQMINHSMMKFHRFMNDSGFTYRENISVKSENNKYTIEVALAGLDKKDIKLKLINNSLVISINKTTDDNKQYAEEQEILLPPDAVQKSLKASMKNGLLTITLNKQQDNVQNININ